MPRALLPLLLLATSLSVQADEDRKLANALFIGDAIFQDSIQRQQQRFVDKARAIAPTYIARARSKRSVAEITEHAARHFDAAHWRNVTWFPFSKDLTLAQQEEVIRFLKTPAGQAFLAALEKSNDAAFVQSRSTVDDFYRALHRAEFDPLFTAPSTSTPEELEKQLQDMFAEPSQ